MYYCYLLFSEDGKRSYIGATNNINKRLRQHNGILKGGAKATCGRTWKRVCHVSGFSSWSDATKFEWRWKRRSLKKGPLIQKRLVGLTNTFKFPYFVGYELEVLVEDGSLMDWIYGNVKEFDEVVINIL